MDVQGGILSLGHPLNFMHGGYLLRNALVQQLFFNRGFFGSVHAAEQQPELRPRKGGGCQQLNPPPEFPAPSSIGCCQARTVPTAS